MKNASQSSCNCIGPRNGEPYCPCMMRGVIERNGRWIQPERDLGPVARRSDVAYPFTSKDHLTWQELDVKPAPMSNDTSRAL